MDITRRYLRWVNQTNWNLALLLVVATPALYAVVANRTGMFKTRTDLSGINH